MACKPRKNQLINEGIAKYRAGNFKGAISLYDAVLSKDPSCTNALTHKGYALISLGKHDEAMRYFEAALKN